MTHPGTGNPITVTDYNDIVATINAFFGTGTGDRGYGGNSTNAALTNLVTKTSGDVIINEDWLELRDAQFDVAAHQGTSLPSPLPSITDIEDGDNVLSFDDQTGPDNPDGEIDAAVNLTLLDANRLIVSPGNVTVASKLTSVRNTAWSSFIEHEFTVDFGSADDARFFFNTGGQLRVSATRTGGAATGQNANWDSILAAGGTFIFDGVAYFLLTGAFQSVPPLGQITTSAYGAYGTNSWTISSRRDDAAGPNGGNGSIIRFKSSFLDGHTNIDFDEVDGTFTSIIEERRSTGIFVKASPTFTTITDLTTGS